MCVAPHCAENVPVIPNDFPLMTETLIDIPFYRPPWRG